MESRSQVNPFESQSKLLPQLPTRDTHGDIKGPTPPLAEKSFQALVRIQPFGAHREAVEMAVDETGEL